MANEIVFRRMSGYDYFVTIRDIADSYKVWEPTVSPAFETWGTGARSLDDYGIEASETFGNGMFTVNMPTGINAAYRLLIEIYRQAGANPADDDVFDGSFELIWNGSNVVYGYDTNGRVDVGLIEGSGAIDIIVGTDGDTLKTLSEQLDTIDTVVDTVETKIDTVDKVVDAIEVKSDKLTFNDDNDVYSIPRGVGAGAITMNYYVYTDEVAKIGPIADCKVWLTTDVEGNSIVASGYTDAFGKITFYVDAGTYYVWRRKTGYNFTNPDTEEVS